MRGENGPKLIMIDGMAQVLELSSRRLSVTRFADFTYDLGGLLTARTAPGRTADELSTLDLLFPTEALLTEAKASRANLLFEAHSRFASPFVGLGVALIAFGALVQGSYSRFGLWRQIALAVAFMVLVQGLATASIKYGLKLEQGWILAYLAPLLAVTAGTGLLWYSQRPRRVMGAAP